MEYKNGASVYICVAGGVEYRSSENVTPDCNMKKYDAVKSQSRLDVAMT